MTPPPCRLSLVFASDAPVVVILRRGPTRWVEVIKWDTERDSFGYGQWLRGRIYAERCGLSPKGKLFVYFAMKYGRVNTDEGYEQTFTAVSRPPFLTALAMWPQGDTWGGGGRFMSETTLRLAYGANGTSHPGVADTQIYMAPYRDPHPRHQPRGLRIETDLDRYASDLGFVDDMDKDGTWLGRDHRNRRILAQDGRLLFIRPNGSEELLKDFNSDAKREVVAPRWASSW
jgi:hypothetical protein